MINSHLCFDATFSDRAFDEMLQEKSYIGYYDLPDQDIDDMLSFASGVRQQDVVVVGIGGSSLGSKAIDGFLRPHSKKAIKNLHFLESTDPITLLSRLQSIDLNNALFIIVSKSGTTIETISIFKYVISLKPINPNDFVVVTDKDSPLDLLANKYGLKTFYIPNNVGGRFSVFSPVGILPLAICGYDVKQLLQGTQKLKKEFFSRGEIFKSLIKKATFYAQNMTKYNINALFSYAEIFRHFNEWYIQLWGESLGKKQRHSELSVGLSPIGLIGPTDQHSFLQLIVEGPRDKTITFIKINDFGNELTIPQINLEYIESLSMLDGISFTKLINMQADAIIEQLTRLELPLDIISLDYANEENIGSLMYSYELLTSLVAIMLDIDAYDQPGVEEGKVILKKSLTKITKI